MVYVEAKHITAYKRNQRPEARYPDLASRLLFEPLIMKTSQDTFINDEQGLVDVEVRRVNTDLEQRVIELTSQLKAANKELDTFSYSVSHDLRAPLRAVNGFAGMILEDFGLHVMDPVFWTGSLSGKAALTMKENQCHELARTTPQA